jgi:hypothetical protein
MISASRVSRDHRRNPLVFNRIPRLRPRTPDNSQTLNIFVRKETNMTTVSHHHQTAKGNDGRRRRSRIPVGLVALLVALVAGCSSSTGLTTAHDASGSPATGTSTTAAPATPAAAHGVEAAVSDVPWSKVGPGWTLAMWSPVTPHRPGEEPAAGEPSADTATTTLYLVDPAGNRYTITTLAPAADNLGLADWSGDGSHALLAAQYPAPATAISVDLHTGAQTTIPVNGYPRYTHPDGKAILVSASSNGNARSTLKRIDLNGNQQVTYPTDQLGGAGQFRGSYLESPDGTQLVLGIASPRDGAASWSDNSMVVMGNDGSVIRNLSTPAPLTNCSPVRWWTSTVILANCGNAGRTSGSQLVLVPLDGGAPTALTAFNSGQEEDPGFGGDIGDGVAWQLPSGTFLQSAGACGTMFLSRLTPDMHTTRVKVPGVSDSVLVTGATTDKLVLLAKVGCGGTTSLLTYDPAANTSTVLLGPPVNGGGVTDALLYPDQK